MNFLLPPLSKKLSPNYCKLNNMTELSLRWYKSRLRGRQVLQLYPHKHIFKKQTVFFHDSMTLYILARWRVIIDRMRYNQLPLLHIPVPYSRNETNAVRNLHNKDVSPNFLNPKVKRNQISYWLLGNLTSNCARNVHTLVITYLMLKHRSKPMLYQEPYRI